MPEPCSTFVQDDVLVRGLCHGPGRKCAGNYDWLFVVTCRYPRHQDPAYGFSPPGLGPERCPGARGPGAGVLK